MSWASPSAGAITSTRPAPSSHKQWVPLPYMTRAVEHLKTRASAGLALDPGLRKTSITLKAFSDLKASGQAQTMLVVAPLRVCRTVWRQEGAKWSEFRHLKFSLLHGPKKSERLKDDADIWLINPEGVAWLCKQYFGRSLPWDIVAIDELTKFKHHDSERSKALQPRLNRVRRRWGLTGSLAPNGYMDLFGQQFILDDGAALGRYITHYRDQYFQVDFTGLDYKLMPGAEKRIIDRITPYWLQMSADDYLQLPPLVDDLREIELEPGAWRTYQKMKRDMLAELPEGVVTAANMAACYSKLSQMANGAVYVTPDKAQVSLIHDGKLDALEELVEELDGQPLLIAYEFNHDLERLRERFGKDLPYLGNGTSAAKEAEWIAAWNRNELPILAAHPASAGHGLNLQEGNAAHVAWFSITWDLELYDQFIRRIRRSGNVAQRIFNHLLVARGTIDELKLAALRDKDMTQTRLLKALNSAILRDNADDPAGGGAPVNDGRKIPMVTRLSRQEPAPATAAPATQEQGRVVPRGWGAPPANAAAPAAVAPAMPDQRERIHAQIAPQAQTHVLEQPAPQTTAFSPAVQEHMREIAAAAAPQPPANDGGAPWQGDTSQGAGAPAPAPQRTRTRTRTAAQAAPAVGEVEGLNPQAVRLGVLRVAFNDPQTSLEEGLEIAKLLTQYVLEG